MEVPAASLAAVSRSRDGQWVTIEDDVCHVAQQLQEIDAGLRVRWSESGGHFAVYHTSENGSEHLVLTTTELDGRTVERVRQISGPSYDYAAELEAMDKVADKAADDRLHEQVGEIGERLAHAIRTDLGYKGRVAVPAKLH